MNDIITTIDVETEVSKYLYRYIFNRVVSRPHAELRHNVHLDPIFVSSCMNSFSFGGNHYQLPYSGSWYLFLLDNHHIQHIKLPTEKIWTCLSDRIINQEMTDGYCTKHHIDIRVICGSTGLCLPRRQIYVIPYSDQRFLIAISSKAIACCTDGSNMPNDLWINFYYHHDTYRFRVFDDSTLSPEEKLNEIKNETYPHMVYQNGYVILNTSEIELSDIEDDGFLEIVEDSDLRNTFDIEVKEDYNSNGSWTLVHVPKSMNPNNYILSNANCDIVLYRKGNESKGLYLNRAMTEKYFQTLTHNDFGITTGFLRSYAKSLSGDGALMMRIYLYDVHRTDVTLTRDANYANCLYQFDDQEIIQHLSGNRPVSLWRADVLNQSAYAKLLCKDYNSIVPSTLVDSIGALGYTASADTVCKRVFHLPIQPSITNDITVTLPVCYIGKQVTVHVYLDGLMLDPDFIHSSVNKQLLHISISPNIKLGPYGCDMKSLIQYMNDLETQETKYFTIEIFEYNQYRAKRFTLAAGTTKNFVVDQDYRVYYEETCTATNKAMDRFIYKRFNPQKAYREFSSIEYGKIQETEITETYRKVSIKNSSTASVTYLVVSKDAYAKICGVEHQLKEMNYDIFCSPLLSVDALEFPDYTDSDEVIETSTYIKVPYLNRNHDVLVYLNRKELTQGLDYQIYPIYSVSRSHICGQFIVFQNVDYLTVANNIMEAYSVMEYQMLSTSGFLTNGRSTLDGYISDYANTGVLFVDGKCYSHSPSNVVGTYSTELHESMRKGASAKIRAFIPQCLKVIFDQYATHDPTILKTVLDYVETTRFDVEAPAILERSHHIYSIFLQTVMEQVLRGKLKYNLNWSDDRIKSNLTKYEDLILFDIGLNSSDLDLRFVDVLPTYRLDPLDADLIVKDKFPILHITGSSSDLINGTYVCINPDLSFVRPGETYCDHTDPTKIHSTMETNTGKFNDQTRMIWKNSKGSIISHTSPTHWTLDDKNGVHHYQAHDSSGTETIWNLTWEPLNDLPITFTTTDIEIHTAGEFPARRIAYTTNISDRNFLTKVARIYLNQDLVQDGVNI